MAAVAAVATAAATGAATPRTVGETAGAPNLESRRTLMLLLVWNQSCHHRCLHTLAKDVPLIKSAAF